jgi:predicted ATPase
MDLPPIPSRYTLLAELGRGGMGVVYRAHDSLLDRPVAVKVLSSANLNDDGRARLLREAQSAARLNHPNIVSVYDAGFAESGAGPLPYIVLELVEGRSLHEQRPAALADTLAIARQICAALEHAHGHGIVHRDLKPENVMLTSAGVAKLMDFGLARSVATRLTAEGMLVGTVFYLAPELALGEPFDLRADLYALGVLLYELTAGRLPFIGDDPIAVVSQHLHAPVVPPSTYNPALPPALDDLIARLLAKQRAGRPASASEVLAALDGLATPQPDQPAPITSAAAPAGRRLVLDRIVRGRLVGRGGPLQQMRDLWGAARQGQGGLALLSGEPGVGKTRLAAEMLVQAQLTGAVVLRGGCYEFEAALPYLPFVEALRSWADPLSSDTLCQHLGGTAAEVAKLIPETAERCGPFAPNPPLSPNEERLRLFENLARLFQSLAAPRGLLLFIDDLHWADQGTLALLRYLLRRLRECPVLILAAYREVELDRAHPLAAALVEWNRERLATRVALGRLSQDDTAALLAALFGQDTVSAELANAIYRETEGNPFFIEEVVKSLIEQGDIYRSAGQWDRKAITDLGLPQSIKEAVSRRLSRLSPACVDVLHTAAALGKVFAFDELAASTALPEDQLLDALDEAAAAQLLRPEVGTTFAFTHDKIREVLYQEQNAIRRRRLHQRIGEALEKLYASPAARAAHVPDLAHHFVQSHALDRALAYSIEAATQARSLFALDDASHHYQHALETAQALDQPETAAALEADLGDVHFQRGLYQTAVEYYQRALAAGLADRQVSLKTRIGMAYTQIGDVRGLDYLHAAERELNPTTHADDLANVLSGLGRFHHYRAEHRRAIEFQERARAIAEQAGSNAALARIYTHLAGAYQHLTEYDLSRHWARECISLGERTGSLNAIAVGHEFLAEDAMGQGHWAEALAHANSNADLAERSGALDRAAWAGFTRAWALHGQGDLAGALEAARVALALADQIGEERLATLMGPVVAMIETDLGHDETARAAAERALRRTDELGQVFLRCIGRHALAYYHLQRAEWAPASALYAECAALWRPTDNRVSALLLGPHAVLACLGLGRLDEAAQLLAEYLALARAAEAPHWVACARRVEGQLLAGLGRAPEAALAFEAAITALAALDSRLEHGRALYHRARFRQGAGLDAAAADVSADLAQAAALFTACAAPRDLARLTSS